MFRINIQHRDVDIFSKIKDYIFVGILEKDYGIFNNRVEIIRGEIRHRQPGKTREFIDQVFQDFHLIYYGLCTFMKYGRCFFLNLITIFPLQSLGTQFNRRQRVFYFMCYSLCSFPPRSDTLSLLNLGNIFEYSHDAHIIVIITSENCCRHQDCHHFIHEYQLNLSLYKPTIVCIQLLKKPPYHFHVLRL